LGCGGIFGALLFARSFFTTSVVGPSVEVVPATINAMVAMQAGHMKLLLALRFTLCEVTSTSGGPAPEQYSDAFFLSAGEHLQPLP
jgi:hypothetical protein